MDEVAEVSAEEQTSTDLEHHNVPSKRASAPISRTPGKDERENTPEEDVVLLSNEQSFASAEPEDGDKVPRSLSQKGRGKFKRQDESIV